MPHGTHHLQPITNVSDQTAKAFFFPDLVQTRTPPKEPVAIAEMAEFFGVTHRTLHFYEEKHLLTARRMGLMRVYGRDDIARMALINVCREVGMPVSVIQDLFEALTTATSTSEANLILEEILLTRRRELASNLSTIHRQLQQLNALLDHEEAEAGQLNTEQKGPTLTETEARCLQLMVEGYTPIRIARTLEMKTEEVSAVEASIVDKLNAQNRFQAVAKAVLLGMVAN
ncbi:DNA-binding transcriptional regulator, MerR family [Rhizobium sp. RU33A]|uniref:MerR family transcriptional regulator n=1 Tax=Rhizobium sp. RU33A TaxID=1907413 RepID=UPI000955DBDD|nr:MerR family transcriptional regulator [Rhizobium sp. RU33A]SIR07882.1 DNA-binding transcriptional regulator, MerR family [Rhizobium sp. RU33A]